MDEEAEFKTDADDDTPTERTSSADSADEETAPQDESEETDHTDEDLTEKTKSFDDQMVVGAAVRPDDEDDSHPDAESGGQADSTESVRAPGRDAPDSPESSADVDITDGQSVDESPSNAPDEDQDSSPSGPSVVGSVDPSQPEHESGESPPTEESREQADEQSTEQPDEKGQPPATEDEMATDESNESEISAMPGVPEEGQADGDERYIPEDVQKYARFQKMDGAEYDRVNQFLRDRTYVTAREWAIARLCADFRTETGIEMTKIGENLPELVPFMTDTYTAQAVNQARSSFETKVRKSGATFLYGAMCDFFSAEELDDIMYEATEVAKFLLEVEGVDLAVEDELEAEERISSVMREVREASKALRESEES